MDGIVCRYFVSAYGCKRGESCPFPHIYSPNRRPDTICRYFLDGVCAFGDQCWHEHSYPPFNSGSHVHHGPPFNPSIRRMCLGNMEMPNAYRPIHLVPQPFTVMNYDCPECAQNSTRYVYENFNTPNDSSSEFYNQFPYIDERNYLIQEMIPTYYQENLNDNLEVINIPPPMQSSTVSEDLSNFQGEASNFKNCNSPSDASNQLSADGDLSDFEKTEGALTCKNVCELRPNSSVFKKEYITNESSIKSDSDLKEEFNPSQASTPRSSDDYSKDISSLNVKKNSRRQNILPKKVKTSIVRDENISDCSSVSRKSFKNMSESPEIRPSQVYLNPFYYFNRNASEACKEECERSQYLGEKSAMATEEETKEVRNKNSKRPRRRRKKNPLAETNSQSEANRNATENDYKDNQLNFSKNPDLKITTNGNKLQYPKLYVNMQSNCNPCLKSKNRNNFLGETSSQAKKELPIPQDSLQVTNRQGTSIKGKYPANSCKSAESCSKCEKSTKFTNRPSQVPEKERCSDLRRKTGPTEKDSKHLINTVVEHHVVSEETHDPNYYGASCTQSKRPRRGRRRKSKRNTEQSSVQNETLSTNHLRRNMSKEIEEGTIEASGRASESIREEEVNPSYSMVLSQNLMKCLMCNEDIIRRDIQKDRRFGILENCSHMYCLKCIYWWRCVKNNETNTSGCSSEFFPSGVHCPACNSYSSCIIPSKRWVEKEDNKINLVKRYKKSLKQIHCIYFNRGQGLCRSGNNCLYLHLPYSRE